MYDKDDFIAFSSMYSDVGGSWRFPKKEIPDELLYLIYNISNKLKINIFNSSNSELKYLMKKVLSTALNSLNKPNKKSKEKYNKILCKLFDENGIEKYYESVDEIKSKCEEENIKIITINDDEYPQQFKTIDEFPFTLYVKGEFPTINKAIGIIGTREVDEAGKDFAFECGKYLAEHEIWNISGLAKGCDEWGHKGSLDGGGYTGAILGQGLAQPIYPKRNRPLAKDILNNNGFLMSELSPDTKVNGSFLISRDRLQSAFNNAILLVETGEKGGSLHTINYALEYGKKVYVWNPLGNLPTDKNELLNNEKLQGNFILLGEKEIPAKFKIKNLHKYRHLIKSIRYKEDIIKKEIDLDKHQNIYDKPKIEKQLRIEDYGIEYANNY
jgi:DNA processing protein